MILKKAFITSNTFQKYFIASSALVPMAGPAQGLGQLLEMDFYNLVKSITSKWDQLRTFMF